MTAPDERLAPERFDEPMPLFDVIEPHLIRSMYQPDGSPTGSPEDDAAEEIEHLRVLAIAAAQGEDGAHRHLDQAHAELAQYARENEALSQLVRGLARRASALRRQLAVADRLYELTADS